MITTGDGELICNSRELTDFAREREDDKVCARNNGGRTKEKVKAAIHSTAMREER